MLHAPSHEEIKIKVKDQEKLKHSLITSLSLSNSNLGDFFVCIKPNWEDFMLLKQAGENSATLNHLDKIKALAGEIIETVLKLRFQRCI